MTVQNEGQLVDVLHVPSRSARSIDGVRHVMDHEWPGRRVVVTTSTLEHVAPRGFTPVRRDYAFQLRTISRPGLEGFELALELDRHPEYARRNDLPEVSYSWRPASDLSPHAGMMQTLLKRGHWMALQAHRHGTVLATERLGRIKVIRLL